MECTCTCKLHEHKNISCAHNVYVVWGVVEVYLCSRQVENYCEWMLLWMIAIYCYSSEQGCPYFANLLGGGADFAYYELLKK